MLAENGPKILEKSNAEDIFRIFRGCWLASLAGFEPTAFRLGGECSILLSYRDIYSKNPYFSRLFGLPGKDRCSFWTLFGLADPSIFSSNFEGDFANEHDILSSVLAKPVKSERRVELQARNEFFKISLLNISLGGGRSIQLSYADIYKY